MRTSIIITVAVLLILTSVCLSTSTEGRQRRNHARVNMAKVPKSKHQRRRSKSIAKHHPSVELELHPVLERTDIFSMSDTIGHKKTHCKVIPSQFSLCYNIGYTKMHLPNLRGHDSIGELVKQSNEWTPLLGTRCHPEARKFLCSVFAPVCVKDFSDPIPPCRSLCTSVRESCSPSMASFNYPWPSMLNCSQFPADDTLCIPSEMEGPVEAHPTAAANVCTPCRRKKINRSFKKKLCSFDFIMKSRVKHVTYQNGNIKLTLEKKSRYVLKWLDNISSKSSKRVKAKKNIVWMTDGLNCTCDVLQDGIRANYLLAGWYDNGKLRLFSITKWRKSNKKLGKVLRRKRCKAVKAKNKIMQT